MEEDGEIAHRTLDLQARGRDVALLEIPAYEHWSKRKLLEGESPALIAHLDAMSMFLLPEEVSRVTEDEFDDLLEDLRTEIELHPKRYL